jgi:hypothetical protein
MNTYVRAGLLSWAVAVWVAYASEAAAKWHRQQAFDCMIRSSGQFWDAGNAGDDGYMFAPTAGGLGIICPAPDNDYTKKADYTTLNVHGFDGTANGAAQAKACITYWNADGGDCGTSALSGVSSTGPFTLQPSRSFWTAQNEAHFGYVSVGLPPVGVGTSKLYGVFYQSP